MMVPNGCEECGCQLEAAPVGMSVWRGTASVSPLSPLLIVCGGKASFLNQLAN